MIFRMPPFLQSRRGEKPNRGPVRRIAGIRLGKGHDCGAIGLDIGLDSLNLVQLCHQPDGSFGLAAAACVEHGGASTIASPSAFKEKLGIALGQAHFRGKRVISALPPALMKIFAINYEVEGRRSDEATIMQILQERMGGNMAEHVVDYLPVRGDAQSKERLALVATARREAVIEHLERLRKAGLEVESLEIGPAAIRRLVAAQCPLDRICNNLVINFAAEHTYLTMVSGRRLLQDQEVAFGEQNLLQQIAGALQTTPAEARAMVLHFGLASGRSTLTAMNDSDAPHTLSEIIMPLMMRLVDEIHRVLIYTASETHGGTVEHIHLLGSLARWPGVAELLQSLCNISVSVLDNPLDLFPKERGLDGRSLVIATGLALRGMSAHG